MKKYYERAQEISDKIIEMRRTLHQCAETGFDLPMTTGLVISRLKELGYEPMSPCRGCVTAVAGDPKRGKTIMLRADMDALPIEEKTDLQFRSVTGASHSCGHDMHTAMLLGAAQILKENEAELNGAVKLVFQPAEELLSGARQMIENGIMENPHVDAAFGLHVSADQPAGYFAFKKGRMMASSCEFVIKITGKGCHGGGSTHMGIDPINVGCHINIALQELIAREVKGLEPAVLSICSFNAGNATNIIPDTAELKGTLRAFSPETHKLLTERLKEVAECTALTFRAKAEVEILSETPSLCNNNEMIDMFTDMIKDVDDSIRFAGRQSMGCEDFAEIAERVPAAYVFLGAAAEDEAARYPLHNSRIVFDEKAMALGAASHAAFAVKWLKENR